MNVFVCLKSLQATLAPLNNDDGGLLPESYLHLINKNIRT